MVGNIKIIFCKKEQKQEIKWNMQLYEKLKHAFYGKKMGNVRERLKLKLFSKSTQPKKQLMQNDSKKQITQA